MRKKSNAEVLPPMTCGVQEKNETIFRRRGNSGQAKQIEVFHLEHPTCEKLTGDVDGINRLIVDDARSFILKFNQ